MFKINYFIKVNNILLFEGEDNEPIIIDTSLLNQPINSPSLARFLERAGEVKTHTSNIIILL